MSRAQKGWSWLGALVTAVGLVGGWTFYAGRAVANAETKEHAEQTYVTKDQFGEVKQSITDIKVEQGEQGKTLKQILLAIPRPVYGPQPQ